MPRRDRVAARHAVATAVVMLGLATQTVAKTNFDKFAVGFDHACAMISGSQKIWCWGQNLMGQLGQGDMFSRGNTPSSLAMPPVDLGGPVSDFDCGATFSCALLVDGNVKCWGNNTVGGLGQGDTVHRGNKPNQMGTALPPIKFPNGLTAKKVSCATGSTMACAIMADNSVICWGNGESNALGYGDNITRGTRPSDMGDAMKPVDLGTGLTAKQISVGNAFACAVLNDDTLKCWGFGGTGRLGLGDEVTRYVYGDALPRVDLGTGAKVKKVTTGIGFACALLFDGTAKCWGSNEFGQLGKSDKRADIGTYPADMGDALKTVDLGQTGGVPAIVDIAAGLSFACAVLEDGTVRCWGRNDIGQLGLGDFGDPTNRGQSPDTMGINLPPLNLKNSAVKVHVSPGNGQACALLSDYALQCWGFNDHGELCYGDNTQRGYSPETMKNLPLVELLPPGGTPTTTEAPPQKVGDARRAASPATAALLVAALATHLFTK